MSGNCELGRGLRRRQKNATEAGAGRFKKPAPDARAAPPEAHESLISRKSVAVVPLTGLSFVLSEAPSGWIDSTGTSFASSSRSTDGSFSVVQQGSNVLLQYVIVPEPAAVTLALIGIAAAAYAVRRRRS